MYMALIWKTGRKNWRKPKSRLICVTHQMLFNTDQVIEVFVIGVCGVGGALLEQMKSQQSWLKNKHIDLRVCGVANSKALLTNVPGLNLENWQEELAQAKEPFNLGRLIRLVKEYHLLNPVIVDCTSTHQCTWP